MVLSRVATVSVLLLTASAFRVKPKNKKESSQVKESSQAETSRAAQIGGIFAYAAPGSADPALQNPRGGPCFPGIRSAAVKMQWFGQEADTATTITGVLGFRHPWMDFKLIDLKNSDLDTLYSCAREGEETGNRPRGTSKIALHAWEGYAERMKTKDLGWASVNRALSDVALPASYMLDRGEASALGQQHGWNLIGSAVDNGDNLYVGRQVSHLFQKSGECILTFQGSSSFQDWTANLNVQKVSFCGYARSGMAISGNETAILSSGQSLVHKGFKDALMEMVKNNDWQRDVRGKFSTCSRVYVTGHSLGAAQAELFGACVQKAPGQGQDGWEDYQHIGW